MEYIVYILYSPNHLKSYTGFTTSLIQRFQAHNSLATKGWTLKYRPWIVVHMEVFDSKKEAMKREKWFKSGQGRIEKKHIIDQFILKYHT